MGNVVTSSRETIEDFKEEWLLDSQENKYLDISRKISHSQYLKVLIFSNSKKRRI